MSLIRPLIRRCRPYLPGEQRAAAGLVKLNTNENPYPPAPAVLRAVRNAIDSRLRLYPNPTASQLRSKLATFHGCSSDNIIVGNGSDELLALATRVFVEPARPAGRGRRRNPRSLIQYFVPSYSLYPVLADLHGATKNPIKLQPNFDLPATTGPGVPRAWETRAALTFVTTPNAPSGREYPLEALAALARELKGVVIFDEAYVDFGARTVLPMALEKPNVLVARTFSKGYSLCFLRVGYMVGPSDLIQALHKARDSYNVNGLAQVAAEATLDQLQYYHRNFRRIRKTRDSLAAALQAFGFSVFPSAANFLLARPPQFPARVWLEKLSAEQILVRWFDSPETRDYLRITIGTEEEVGRLLEVIRQIRERRED